MKGRRTKRSAHGTLSILRAMSKAATRQALLADQSGRCRYCGRRLDGRTATLDHVKPLAMGGPDRLENYAAACWGCNQAKGDAIWGATGEGP